MTTTTITITWKAFSNPELLNRPATSASVVIDYDTEVVSDERVCDIVFSQTNCYEGSLWNKLEPLLPANRTHTALSVGDEVTIDNNNNSRTYRCDNFGWSLLTEKVGA
jgi:hypothetical protein